MRLTFLADLRSPPARQWIGAFLDRGHVVQAISSHPVEASILPGASVHVVPLVWSRLQAELVGHRDSARDDRSPLSVLRRVATPTRAGTAKALVGPLTVRLARQRLQALVDTHRADVFHAMRVPYEGMAAAYVTGVPLVVSTWGNDFTLHAGRTPFMANATRKTMQAACAIHSDCHRDARLARTWGFASDRPVWVLPGNGGVIKSVFRPGASGLARRLNLPHSATVIMNPRGDREYVRNDIFFAALPRVLDSVPDVHVVCPGMASSVGIARQIRSLGLESRVHLLPPADREEMADMFRGARISVSLSTHDGTPNTLLEAMACGALPVVGDVDSVMEWVTDGQNGLIAPPGDLAAVGAALLQGLTDDALLARARPLNRAIVDARATFTTCINQMEQHYASLLLCSSRVSTTT